MTRKSCLTLILCCVLSVGIPACGSDEQGQDGWQGSVETQGEVTVIKNPSTPLFGSITLELEEDLVLGDTIHEHSFFFNRISAKVDGQGNIYIWDPNSYRIQKFDPEGGFLQTIGRRGEGPGEFSQAFGLTFLVAESGRLFGRENGRIHVFDEQGEYERPVPISPTGSDFAVLSEDRFAASDQEFTPEGSFEQVLLTDGTGRALGTVGRFESLKWNAVMRERPRFTLHYPELVLSPLAADRAVYGYPLEYRIFLTDGSGEVARIVERGIPAEPFAPAHRTEQHEEILRQYPNLNRREVEERTFFPDSWPFYDALHTDDAGNIWVQRVRPGLGGETDLLLDLFSAEGVYLYEMVAPVDNILDIRNGHLYSRRFDSTMNCDQLIRYRIVSWSEIAAAAAEFHLPGA